MVPNHARYQLRYTPLWLLCYFYFKSPLALRWERAWRAYDRREHAALASMSHISRFCKRFIGVTVLWRTNCATPRYRFYIQLLRVFAAALRSRSDPSVKNRLSSSGGEGGIRTLATLHTYYSLSRGAP